MTQPNAILKTKNINSKLLFKEINDYVFEGINSNAVRWKDETHRKSFVEVIEEFLEELAENSKITQFKVMCDRRNNSMEDLEKGIVKLTIKFVQKNCLNISEIEYQIS